MITFEQSVRAFRLDHYKNYGCLLSIEKAQQVFVQLSSYELLGVFRGFKEADALSLIPQIYQSLRPGVGFDNNGQIRTPELVIKDIQHILLMHLLRNAKLKNKGKTLTIRNNKEII